MSGIKILLVQLFSNGDCLYATAVARQIKHDFPGCHLTWAVATFCKTIIAGNPYIDEVMEVSTVPKNDIPAFRRFKKQIEKRKAAGEWDEVFITQIMGSNEANYDGCIRSAIFRGYGKPITVPVTPSLYLTVQETEKVHQFAADHALQEYEQVILFEFAPMSGQSRITRAFALEVAENIVQYPRTAIILSSAQKIDHPNTKIIDGSGLSFRETAALTHYCTLLLGCSSGITWISTAMPAARQLQMIQLLNPFTTWVNPVSRDFARFGLPVQNLIELIEFDAKKVVACVSAALNNFPSARANFHQAMPLHFKTTRNIVYNLLCYANFSYIIRHIRVNREIYGNHPAFYKELIMGFVIFPFRLVANFFKKRVFKKRP